MNIYTCKNKHCGINFFYNGKEKVFSCPVCKQKMYNMERIATPENCLYIDSMLKIIDTYGQNAFQVIDSTYRKPETRARVRKLYFETLEALK